MPSSKVTTTWDSPNFEMERTPVSRGRPPIACSMGNVIWRSASSGESEGETVLIWTWTGVVSGKASISRCRIATNPSATKASAPAITRKRCRRDRVMIQLSMGLLAASA